MPHHRRGVEHTPEAKAKMREAWTSERRAKHAAKIRGSWTAERRAEASARQRARMEDPELLARMNATHLANRVDHGAWITPNEAQAFLIEATAKGPAEIRPTKHQAAEAGITEDALKEARLSLGLVTVTVDGKKCWARPEHQ